MRTIGAAALVSVTLAGPGTASEPPTTLLFPEAALGLISYVEILFDDQVKGQCWTNVPIVRTNTTLEFERNDVQVLDYSSLFNGPMNPMVTILAIGGRVQGGFCTGTITFDVEYYTNHHFYEHSASAGFSFHSKVSMVSDFLLATSPGNLNSYFSDFVEEKTAELLTSIIRGRRRDGVKAYRATNAHLFEKPVSIDEVGYIGESGRDPVSAREFLDATSTP